MALWSRASAAALVVLLAWSCMGSAVTSESFCPLISPLSAFPSSANGAKPALDAKCLSQLESTIQSYVSTTAVPQYAVSVVIGNQTVFTSGLANTPFLIGSVTKTFTALGALVLREQGRLSLEDPVNKFLPDFSIINPYTPHNVTIRELMGHVSGMPRELCASIYVPGQSEEECPIIESDVLELISKMQLVRPPWSREPDYSNLGFALLGHTWEKATSPPLAWDAFIKQYILDPLQMTGSGVDSSNVTLAGRNSTGAPEFDIGWVAPAGQIFSTAIDLAKYLTFIMTATPPLISDVSIREWTRSSNLFPDGKGAFALPWELLSTSITPEFLITKGGAIGDYTAFIAIHAPTQIGVSALITVNDSTTGTPEELGGALLAELIPAVEELTAKAIYSQFAGFYNCVSSGEANEPVPVSNLNVSFSPDIGLFAIADVLNDVNATSEAYSPQAFGLLPKNFTENSFWFGDGSSCLSFFGGISSGPSTDMPNAPGTFYANEVIFDLARETLVLPFYSILCKRVRK